jgi:hypothetical protein
MTGRQRELSEGKGPIGVDEALLPTCQIVAYIFVDRSGQKRGLIGETHAQNLSPGERRRQENLEWACIAEPISSHEAYPRGSCLREVSCRK